MMLRSRKRQSEIGGDYDDSKSKQKGGNSNGGSGGNSTIIPTPILIGLVVLFLFLGYASEHYNRTRSQDPFTGTTLVHPSKAKQLAAAGASSLSLSNNNNNKEGSLLTPEEDTELEYDGDLRYHVIFSTDCSPYQHWQSYLVYYTAMKVRQFGHVTRIASGCEGEEEVAMKTWFDENIQFMSKRFHLHLTPAFSQVKNDQGEVVGDYKFFNKPFGLKHWLENFELLGYDGNNNNDNGKFQSENDIVILIDPDMAILRPITADFTSDETTVIGNRRKNHVISRTVKHGVPFAQTYGLGTQWQRFDLDKIAGEDSPAKQVSQQDGALYFPVGPPYLATVRDMYSISQKWTEFVPRVHAQYPYLLAEMYAFCIAAAHLELRHQIIDSLMISNPITGGEGWPLIDKIPAEQVCDFGRQPDTSQYPLPNVAHLCQRYCVGNDWFFGKRKIPANIYECETPLFIEPPSDLALLYDFKKPPNAKEKTNLSPQGVKQHTFMVCYLTSLINEAATFYKTNACTSADHPEANYEKSRKVADLFLSQGN